MQRPKTDLQVSMGYTQRRLLSSSSSNHSHSMHSQFMKGMGLRMLKVRVCNSRLVTLSDDLLLSSLRSNHTEA